MKDFSERLLLKICYTAKWHLSACVVKMNPHTHSFDNSHNNKRNNRNAYPHTITNIEHFKMCNYVSPFIWPGVLLYYTMIKRCRHSKLNRKWTTHFTARSGIRARRFIFYSDEEPVECRISRNTMQIFLGSSFVYLFYNTSYDIHKVI